MSHAPRVSRRITSTSRKHAARLQLDLARLVLASIASAPAASLTGEAEYFARFYSWYCSEIEQDGQKETLKGQCDGTPVVTQPEKPSISPVSTTAHRKA